jgi:hypothetical protein
MVGPASRREQTSIWEWDSTNIGDDGHLTYRWQSAYKAADGDDWLRVALTAQLDDDEWDRSGDLNADWNGGFCI